MSASPIGEKFRDAVRVEGLAYERRGMTKQEVLEAIWQALENDEHSPFESKGTDGECIIVTDLQGKDWIVSLREFRDE